MPSTSTGKKTAHSLFNRSLVSIYDLSKQQILDVLTTASKMERLKPEAKAKILAHKTVASLFFEPSTRTRLSFEAAIQNLGANVIGFSDENVTSLKKGESFSDTIKMVCNYAHAIVMRHPITGHARIAAGEASVPVINAGDGTNEHPTQNLLDLYTIKKRFGRLNGLKIGFLGDLKFSRTIKGLVHALNKLGDNEYYFIAPHQLRMEEGITQTLKGEGCKIEQGEHLENFIGLLDILYVTRIQKERFASHAEYERLRGSYQIDKGTLARAKKTLALMHPLPRIDEISRDVDELPQATYFQQAHHGLPVREAILSLILGGKHGKN